MVQSEEVVLTLELTSAENDKCMLEHEHNINIKSFSDRSPINEEFSVKSATGVGAVGAFNPKQEGVIWNKRISFPTRFILGLTSQF